MDEKQKQESIKEAEYFEGILEAINRYIEWKWELLNKEQDEDKSEIE